MRTGCQFELQWYECENFEELMKLVLGVPSHWKMLTSQYLRIHFSSHCYIGELKLLQCISVCPFHYSFYIRQNHFIVYIRIITPPIA